jgi:hypothetical protein
MNVRLGRVVTRQVVILEPLAAFVANQRLRARLSSFGGADGKVARLLIVVLIFRVGEELIERLILVRLEPFERLVDCSASGFGYFEWLTAVSGKGLRAPAFLMASSARSFSKPISRRRFRSDDAMSGRVAVGTALNRRRWGNQAPEAGVCCLLLSTRFFLDQYAQIAGVGVVDLRKLSG